MAKPPSLRTLLAMGILFVLGETISAEPASNGQPSTSPLTAGAPNEKNTVQVAGAPALPAIENSVVKIFCSTRYPDIFRPWSRQPPQEISGSGVVIEGKRILTNAHVVLYAGQVQIQANQSGEKLQASVEAIAPLIDLAVLKLENESFFDDHSPIPRASVMPDIKEPVLAYGFPTGGASLSITKGIVSRIEFTPYIFPVSGLRIQVDAAINPGNSGGPAISGDRMIGLAFSMLGGAQNIGYIIPNEEIDLFLADVKDGTYEGKSALFDEFQRMQNPTLHAFLRLPKGTEGVIVTAPFRNESDYPLKKWDVITHIAGSPIDNEGMIKSEGGLRLRFDYLVQHKTENGLIKLRLIREGKPLEVNVPVSSVRPILITDLQGAYPSYFVYGPLVFSHATAQFTSSINRESWEGMAGSATPLVTRRGDMPAFPGEQLVIVSSPLFPHRLGQGYWNPVGWVLRTVNDKPVGNLRKLVEILRDEKSDFIAFEFEGRGVEKIVLPRKETLAATEEILNDNGVRAQASPDLLPVWNAGKP